MATKAGSRREENGPRKLISQNNGFWAWPIWSAGWPDRLRRWNWYHGNGPCAKEGSAACCRVQNDGTEAGYSSSPERTKLHTFFGSVALCLLLTLIPACTLSMHHMWKMHAPAEPRATHSQRGPASSEGDQLAKCLSLLSSSAHFGSLGGLILFGDAGLVVTPGSRRTKQQASSGRVPPLLPHNQPSREAHLLVECELRIRMSPQKVKNRL